MVERGAKNLVLISRRGPITHAAKQLLTELATKKVCIETPACDITNFKDLKILFQDLSGKMPAIKGVFQMSIVAKVSSKSFPCM